MRIVLFGDDLGIPRLLRHLPHSCVCGLVAASNRPRSHDAVRQCAAEIGLEFFVQPAYRDDTYSKFVAWAAALQPDLIWVSSYSMILRPEILAVPWLGGINLHAALLPHNRGCNPIQWGIIHGETEGGVTLHEITPGIDEGPIIDQRRVPIDIADDWMVVRDRIAGATDDLIATNLPRILAGSWTAATQDAAQATYGRRRTAEDGRFDWSMPVIDIHNRIRALLPPLPPAFYVDAAGVRVPMTSRLTPQAVAGLKFGAAGGGVMQSERVRLRLLRKSDSGLLYEWITNRDLVLLNSTFHPVSEVDHEAWVESMLAKRSDLVIFVIEERSTAAAIGTCQLLNINWRHRSAELQIRIGDTACRGRGLGTEAVRLLCEFGFADLNLHRIYLHAFASNTRAIGTYEKAGFVREGLLRQAAHIDGQWVDVVPMGLIREYD